MIRTIRHNTPVEQLVTTWMQVDLLDAEQNVLHRFNHRVGESFTWRLPEYFSGIMIHGVNISPYTGEPYS